MRRLLPALAALCALSACHSVRTVYDANGKVVEEHDGATESDLNARLEGEFNAAFSEEKKNGVPTATSRRVSRFQKALDEAQREDKVFATGSFKDGKQLSLRDESFTGRDKRFVSEGQRRDKESREAYSRELRPDFMNESHGISSSQRYGADSAARRGAATDETQDFATVYATHAAAEQRDTPAAYIEERRHKTPQPTIIDSRDYYRQSIRSTRSLLGRDRTENSPNGGAAAAEE
ncbi:MAG: hypothetical protein ACI4OS_06285 [Akkermansia sp.]